MFIVICIGVVINQYSGSQGIYPVILIHCVSFAAMTMLSSDLRINSLIIGTM